MIVAVHYAGMPCAMDEILELAQRHDLIVVEDAAQALLSRYKGKALGSIGHLGCLSFHETKNVISGEGGALLVNAPDLVKRAEIIREKGTNRCQFFRGEVDKYTWVDVGSSYLPSELIGAFLCAQLEHSDEINAARWRIFDLYCQGLRPLEQQGRLRLPFIPANCAANGHLFYIITGSLEERTRLIAYLKSMGILAVFHYVPLHSSPGGRRFGRVGGDMAVTNDISDRLLRLPLYYGMSDQDVGQVVSCVHEFYAGPG
jgi:dTDP-4-amino-4,6-dideoxygalactose transaminase